MNPAPQANSPEQYIIGVMSGRERGVVAGALRLLMRCAEPGYAALMRLRNALYDRSVLRSHRLARPVISIGNITAGGTGKTPMTQFVADLLAEHRPAILLRGYRSNNGMSDEAAMLQAALGPTIPVEARRDRVAGAEAVLTRDPTRGFFILDDGFQHRRVWRDLDVVLISALEPFGFGHVHPRGLLREPLTGLRRASAIIVTRMEAADADRVASIERTVRQFKPEAPIFHAAHRLTSLISHNQPPRPLTELKSRRVFVFSGIGNPDAFSDAVGAIADVVASRNFADHHAYTDRDLRELRDAARAAQAEMLITTSKDWPKITKLLRKDDVPEVACVEMQIEMSPDEREKLRELIVSRLFTERRSAPSSASSPA